MKKEMDVIFLLDRSGSMIGMEKDTIGGYNSYLEKQRKSKYDTKITTILFDNEYEVLKMREDIKNVKNLTSEEYFVRGCTALYDAIGKTINSLEKKVNNKVLFVITTDGLENASVEYNKKTISKLIKKHKDWEFMYVGANIDSYAEGESIGIKRSNIANYKKTKEGAKALFESIGDATMCYEKSNSIGSFWKQKLEK